MDGEQTLQRHAGSALNYGIIVTYSMANKRAVENQSPVCFPGAMALAEMFRVVTYQAAAVRLGCNDLSYRRMPFY